MVHCTTTFKIRFLLVIIITVTLKKTDFFLNIID